MEQAGFIIPNNIQGWKLLADYGTSLITIVISLIFGFIASRLLFEGVKFINTRYLNNYLFKNQMNYFSVLAVISLIAVATKFILYFEFYQDLIWISDPLKELPLIVGFVAGLPDIPYKEPNKRTIIYERWLEFSLRLADILDVTPARKERLKKEIKSFISMYSPDNQNYADKPILGWDDIPEGWHCIGDHANEFFEKYSVWNPKREEYTGKFHEQLLSCIRAGLDIAVPDMCGGGVVGFTVGDLRKAFSGKIPTWVMEPLELTGNEKDEDGVWL